MVYGEIKFMTFRRVCALALTLVSVGSAMAEVTFSLTIRREVKPAYEAGYGPTRYYAWPSLSDTTPSLSHHRVESPTDICSANFGTNTGASGIVFNNAAQLLNALTNGDWKLWLNRDTPQEEFYTFTLATGSITSNSLGAVIITTPANGGINVASNTPYTWTGPVDFDDLSVTNRNVAGTALVATETSWPSGPTLDPGTNFFCVTYRRNVTADYIVSIPTNNIDGTLTNWVVNYIVLKSSAESGFITEGLPPTPLAAALDAPGMIWETGGAANWCRQTTNTTDGVDAAQSGPIQNNESTTLRTVIYGTNTISFAWRVDSEAWADYVEFTDNGNYVEDLTGSLTWQQFTYHLTDGEAHVLEWTYNKDSSEAEGADAAFLDQVRLGPNTLPAGTPMQFNLTINREQKPAHDLSAPNQLGFWAQPSLATTNPPISYHEVRSPHAWYIATFGPTNTSVAATFSSSFTDMVNELTNGNWTLRLNRQTPQEQFFTFTVSGLSLTSNDLPVVSITSPANDSSNISPHINYQWASGWVAADELVVTAYQFTNDSPFIYASETLSPATVTAWVNGPVLEEGTNYFEVRYTQAAPTNIAVSVPFLGWVGGMCQHQSIATASFIVSNAIPVLLLSPQVETGCIRLEFLSQIGFTNVIQSRTNLTLGDWVDRTNILGDGTLKTITFPLSTEPTEFFRIRTE